MTSKSVLITGCSEGGIGSALAVAFQKRDRSVFATERDRSKFSYLEKFANVTLLSHEPTIVASVKAAVEEVKNVTDPKLDYLTNNAGQTLITSTLNFDIETAKNMYDINV